MDTEHNTDDAAGGAMGAVELRIPDYSKMGMSELRLYFQTLRMLGDALNGQTSSPLAKGPESEVSDWLDDAFTALDTLRMDLMQFLQNSRLEGTDERFRLCMLIEHDAWLGESVEDIARTIRAALVPLPPHGAIAAGA